MGTGPLLRKNTQKTRLRPPDAAAICVAIIPRIRKESSPLPLCPFYLRIETQKGFGKGEKFPFSRRGTRPPAPRRNREKGAHEKRRGRPASRELCARAPAEHALAPVQQVEREQAGQKHGCAGCHVEAFEQAAGNIARPTARQRSSAAAS